MLSANLSPSTGPNSHIENAEKAARICNACRYCEGFCAVFPAMERRTVFGEKDLNYLANLCHNCGECFYSCQYAPPHEFALHFPHAMAKVRRESYKKYAWPSFLSALFERPALALIAATTILPFFLFAAMNRVAPEGSLFTAHSDSDGAFYGVLPHTWMIGIFSVAGLFAFVALLAGLLRFWRDIGEPTSSLFGARALLRAISDSARLRYLDGGGDGCAYPGEIPSKSRKIFHHFTSYGFLLCFAATTVAAIYHNILGRSAPYPWASLPVLLGIAGGVGLLLGPAGLLWLKQVREPEMIDGEQSGMDAAFLVFLLLTSVTGFLLLILRESPVMGVILAAHLGIVLGLFLTMPYGKFVHGIYRFAALVKNALEENRSHNGHKREI